MKLFPAILTGIMTICAAITQISSAQTYQFTAGLNDEFKLPEPANLRVFNAPEDINALLTEGHISILEDENNMAYIQAEYQEAEDENSFWSLEMELSDGMNWDDWSSQDFPTSYRDDSEMVGLEYENWSYYIITCAKLIGSGNREGAYYDLVHAPSNFFFAFQLGNFANGWNSGFGATVWATGDGVFVDSSNETYSSSASFTLNFDIDESSSTSVIQEDYVGVCSDQVSGCTLEFATNYNSDAELDNGECEFDFTVCDCLGNVHSPYVFLNLGDGNPDDDPSLYFVCDIWGFDCGDLDVGTDSFENICNGTAITANYGCISSVNEQIENQLEIYPNPSNGIMNAVLNGIGNELLIFSIEGKHVQSFAVPNISGNFQFDISHLNSGIYLVEYGNSQRRLIIE